MWCAVSAMQGEAWWGGDASQSFHSPQTTKPACSNIVLQVRGQPENEQIVPSRGASKGGYNPFSSTKPNNAEIMQKLCRNYMDLSFFFYLLPESLFLLFL